MTVSLLHAFTNPKADGGDATITRPSDWNAQHNLTCAASIVLGRATAGTGVVEELPIDVATTGEVNIPSTTASTTPTTGALTVAGGLGVSGAIYSANTINIPSLDTTGGQYRIAGAAFARETSGYHIISDAASNDRLQYGFTVGDCYYTNTTVVFRGMGPGFTPFVTLDSGGLLVVNSGGRIGYGTGAGGAVTQTTSRTTGVTLDKASGAITLFAAAPTVGTWVSFTVTNSIMSATDTISLSVASGTNTYIAHVTAVAAGSFQISFTSIVGTSSDSPVINFNIINGVTS